MKDRHPEVIVVVLSGHDPSDSHALAARGADGFVTKTAAFDAMRSSIDSILDVAS